MKYLLNTLAAIMAFGMLTVVIPASAIAGIVLTDSTNLALEAQAVGDNGAALEVPDITGGDGGGLVHYTEVGTNAYSCCNDGGREGIFGPHNLNDGDVGIGNLTIGAHAIPDHGLGTVVMQFDAGFVEIAGIAIYHAYWNRQQGDFVLKDGNGTVLGKWESRSGNAFVTNRYWLTFPTPVTTDRLVIDTVGVGPFGNSILTASFREIQVFSLLPNEPPTANPGPNQAIRSGDPVNLDGSASFDDNTVSEDLEYAWKFISTPMGSTATLIGDTTVEPSFTADLDGTYVVELVVTDESACPSDPVQVELGSNTNLAPTAAAGDEQLVIIATSGMLDGSGSSDPETDPLTFYWELTSAPAGSLATVDDPLAQITSITPDLEGLYEVTLTVSDFLGEGTPDTVEITATTAESFAEDRIMCAADIVSGLGSSQVTTKGNQKAFLNFLRQSVSAIQEGETATAIEKLEKSIDRVDGCEATGSPDGNGPGRDWVTDCAAQASILICLREALDALTP